MSYKKFNFYIITILIGLFLFNILFNIAIDPFYIFKTPIIKGFNEIKPDLKKQERLTKILEYKINKNKFNTLFFGSSRVDYGIDSCYCNKYTGNNTFNFAIKGTGITETANYIKSVVKKNKNLKNIFVGVDFFAFSTPLAEINSDNDKFYYSPSINLNELATVLISQDAFASSYSTLIANIIDNTDVDFNLNGIKQEKKDSNAYDTAINEMGIYINDPHFYKHFKLSNKRFDDVKEIKKICAENKINLIFFVNPINIVQLQAIKSSNNWENYKIWKEKLAEITPYYDFSGYNDITTEPLSKKMKFYFDSNHYKQSAGNKIINVLEKKKIPDNFGILINEKNVLKYNKITEEQHNKWTKNNQDLVKQINSLRNW